MGRLFQYNRFGQSPMPERKHNPTRNDVEAKQQTASHCISYSELYTAHNPSQENATTTTATTTTTQSAALSTTSATTTATTTGKSVELAIKKCQQWSSKFLLATTTTTTTIATTTPKASLYNVEPVSQCISSASTTTTATSTSASVSASSGYRSRSSRSRCDSDREMLVSAVKRTKVYDCMKDFLKRKLFQQTPNGVETSHYTRTMFETLDNEKKQPREHDDDEDEDATSDYDELDMLDSSYNADEEDATDCSSDCTYPMESNSSDDEEMLPCQPITPKSISSPQKSVLSFNCWQNSSCADTGTEEEADELEIDDEDSDAGISDCCQLIAEKKSPQRRKPKELKRSYDTLEPAELLEASWYQPRISSKTAMARLLAAQPGSFLVRRKANSYELFVRVETKVKQFTVVSDSADQYKLKGARKQFSSLKALVTHHSVMAEQLPLTLDLPRETDRLWTHSSVRCADDFDTFESLQILGILKSLQAKSLEFS